MQSMNGNSTKSKTRKPVTPGRLWDFALVQPHRLYSSAKMLFEKDAIIVQWSNRGRLKYNWGDALNPVIIKLLSGKEPILRRHVYNYRNGPVYTVIGSMLGGISDSNNVVWGSGFMSSDSYLKGRPREVCAVRGPLSRQKIVEAGVDCPEVYGDPALLYPLFYKPEVEQKFELGIIPHYREQDFPPLDHFREDPSVRFIDITDGINDVVDQVSSCKVIASSSLHGLILADAYGVPGTWIKLTNNPVGDGFKFRDYLASVGREETAPLVINDNTTTDQILGNVRHYQPQMDLGALLDTCPFLDPAVGAELAKAI